MPDAPRSLDAVQLGAYFALIEVTSLLRHAVEQQLRDAGDLSYVQFQLLARLGDCADGQPPHDRPGRRRRLQPQRPDLPGRPAGEGGPGHARSRPRTTSAASRSRSPTPAARGSRRCSPATSSSSARCSSTRSQPPTSRSSPGCSSRCATTCAPFRPARPHPVVAAPAHRELPGTPQTNREAWRLATAAAA